MYNILHVIPLPFILLFIEISDAQLIFIQRPTDILNARIGCDYAVSCTVSGADQLEWRLTNGDAIMNSDTRSTSVGLYCTQYNTFCLVKAKVLAYIYIYIYICTLNL